MYRYHYKGTNLVSPRQLVMLDKAPQDLGTPANEPAIMFEPKEGIYNGQIGKFYNLAVNYPQYQAQSGNPWRIDFDSYRGPTVYNTNLIGPGDKNNPDREREVYAIGFLANDAAGNNKVDTSKQGPLIDTPKATTGQINVPASQPQSSQPTGGKRRPRRTLLLNDTGETLLGN